MSQKLKIETIRRNLVLKQLEIKESPDGKQTVFSIKFFTKSGEVIFMPRAVSAGLRMNMKENSMRGVIAVDDDGDAQGHVTPVHIDAIKEFNGIKVKM